MEETETPFSILNFQFSIMEVLCKIRDIYRAIAEFEAQFEQAYGLSLNEGMLLCTLLSRGKLSSSEVAEALGLSASDVLRADPCGQGTDRAHQGGPLRPAAVAGRGRRRGVLRQLHLRYPR